MGYKTFASLNIAVIGAGHTGKSFATAFALAGHHVFLAWRDGDEPQVGTLLQTLTNLTICSIEEAAAVADVILIATPPAHVREVAYWLGDVRRKVIIDVSAAHLWDITAVGALDKIVLKYRKAGIEVEVLGFNEASADMVDRFALHDKDERLAASAALH